MTMSAAEHLSTARRFVVRGRVQGVGFRWFVEREAHMLGVYGWVRNNPDGSVEVLATGTREQLSGLRSRLQNGPRAARGPFWRRDRRPESCSRVPVASTSTLPSGLLRTQP